MSKLLKIVLVVIEISIVLPWVFVIRENASDDLDPYTNDCGGNQCYLLIDETQQNVDMMVNHGCSISSYIMVCTTIGNYTISSTYSIFSLKTPPETPNSIILPSQFIEISLQESSNKEKVPPEN
ncbi:hypothetical protein ACTA71_005224 [Dictyostelium dimigraforme]